MNLAKQPFVIASNLNCIRGERRLFENVHFSLCPGEVMQVIGPNGVGKTSLLRIVAGLLSLESGELSCRVDSFYLGHQLGLKETFTLEENLRFDLRYPEPSSEKLDSLLSDVGLSLFLKEKASVLSRGQKQKLALVKCLLSPAVLWILDEPFVALDDASREFWNEKILMHVEQGGAVMISSHLPLLLPDEICKKIRLSEC